MTDLVQTKSQSSNSTEHHTSSQKRPKIYKHYTIEVDDPTTHQPTQRKKIKFNKVESKLLEDKSQINLQQTFLEKYQIIDILEKEIQEKTQNQITFVQLKSDFSKVFVCKELKQNINNQNLSNQDQIQIKKCVKQMKTEVEFLNKIWSQNSESFQQSQRSRIGVIQLVEYEINSPHPFLILESAKNGQLKMELRRHGRFSEDLTRAFFIQLLDAIELLFKNGICHRDLKPENIVITEDLDLLLIDFGYAVNADANTRLNFKADEFGTISYLAPEVLQQTLYSPQDSDLFALGKILFEMCTGKSPFQESFNPYDCLYKYIQNKKYTIYWQKFDVYFKSFSSTLSNEFKDLVFKMLAFDPKDRLIIDLIREHPWLKNKKSLNNQEIKFQFDSRRKTQCKEENL